MSDEGLTGTAQSTANNLVDAAQAVANEAIDLGEEAVHAVLSAVLTANKLLGDTLETLAGKLTG